jgi:hypothetical protein
MNGKRRDAGIDKIYVSVATHLLQPTALMPIRDVSQAPGGRTAEHAGIP